MRNWAKHKDASCDDSLYNGLNRWRKWSVKAAQSAREQLDKKCGLSSRKYRHCAIQYMSAAHQTTKHAQSSLPCRQRLRRRRNDLQQQLGGQRAQQAPSLQANTRSCCSGLAPPPPGGLSAVACTAVPASSSATTCTAAAPAAGQQERAGGSLEGSWPVVVRGRAPAAVLRSEQHPVGASRDSGMNVAVQAPVASKQQAAAQCRPVQPVHSPGKGASLLTSLEWRLGQCTCKDANQAAGL